MNIFVISTDYLDTGFFGTYSSLHRATLVLEKFLAEDENIVSINKLGGYTYEFAVQNGNVFHAEIMWDIIDAEFEEGMIKD